MPNIDRLCAEGVTFRNHFTQAVPCGPARASLLTGLYLMNHRAVQNTMPLDARFTNLGHELRRGGYDPALVGYTTTTPDPRTTGPQRSALPGAGRHHGRLPSGRRLRALQGRLFRLGREPGLQAAGEPRGHLAARGRATAAPAPRRGRRASPRSCPTPPGSPSAALTYLQGRGGKPWFLHLGYYRPHPPFIAPAPYHAMYRPEDMPQAGARGERRGGGEPASAARATTSTTSSQASFFQDGKGLGSAMSEAAGARRCAPPIAA